jgi:hypothetical protein
MTVRASCLPTVAGLNEAENERNGKGSAYSNSLDVQQLVTMQGASTQSVIQLTDFYYLVINYNYVLIYNKHCN